MLGCVQHSYSCCIDRIGYSGKQLHSNGNSGLLGMRPLQKNSGNAFQSMCRYPLLKQGNHYRHGVEKNVFKREKTLLSGYPFFCLSVVEKDSCTVQQSDVCVIDIVSPAMGHSQEAHPESNLSVPAITSALEKMELAPKHCGSDIIELENCILAVHSKSYVSALQKAMDLASQDGLVYVSGPTYASSTAMDLASQDGLVYVSGPTYASSTVRASSISYKPPPIGFGHHPIPKGRIGFCTFGNVAARRVQHISFATVSQLIRHGRAKKRHKTQNRGLSNCPQKQGVCLLVKESLPKKPNSGKRKTARVRMSNGQDVTCLIPGEGHNLMEHSIVLVRGGGVNDLPGVNYRCIRGTRDLKGIPERKRGRSKSGTKKARKKPENQKPNTQKM